MSLLSLQRDVNRSSCDGEVAKAVISEIELIVKRLSNSAELGISKSTIKSNGKSIELEVYGKPMGIGIQGESNKTENVKNRIEISINDKKMLVNAFIDTKNKELTDGYEDITSNFFDLATIVETGIRMIDASSDRANNGELGIQEVLAIFRECIVCVEEYESREVVAMLMEFLTKTTIAYTDSVCLCGKDVKVRANKLNELAQEVGNKFNEKNIEELRKNTDALIGDQDRRSKGDFYTPMEWVREAHKMIEKQLGEDWKQKCTVWDSACGTCNLTREYEFGRNNRNLMSSTIGESEIAISSDLNSGAMKFQYDFLNDDIDEFERILAVKNERMCMAELGGDGHVSSMLDEFGLEVEDTSSEMIDMLCIEDFKDTKLYRACNGRGKEFIDRWLHGEPLVFLINPPYGTGSDMRVVNGKSERSGMSDTKVCRLMKKSNLGKCASQLYAQFVYRILRMKELFSMTNVSLFMYSHCGIKQGVSFRELRKKMSMEWGNTGNMMFCASDFADCSDSWAILFSMWEPSKKDRNEALMKRLNENRKVEDIGIKKFNTSDNEKPLYEELKNEIYGLPTMQMPQLTSAIEYANTEERSAYLTDGIGFCAVRGNLVGQNNQGVWISSAGVKGNCGFAINDSNFERFVAFFTARRVISGSYANWTNELDEYLVPDWNKQEMKEFIANGLVYSLFDSKSGQSSLRDIEFQGEKRDIVNHFFWRSTDDIRQLATEMIQSDNERCKLFYNSMICDIDKTRYDNRFSDKAFYGERYVHVKLDEYVELMSDEAINVLKEANRLFDISFKDRWAYDLKNPKLGLVAWDAGWYQIKSMLKIGYKDGLNEFSKELWKLADKLRPMVYSLGFLKK